MIAREAGGIETIVKMLNRHIDNHKLCESCCAALGYLAKHNCNDSKQ